MAAVDRCYRTWRERTERNQQEIAIAHIPPQTINLPKAIQELSLAVPLQDCEKGETLFVPIYLEKMQNFRMIPQNIPQLTTTTPPAFNII